MRQVKVVSYDGAHFSPAVPLGSLPTPFVTCIGTYFPPSTNEIGNVFMSPQALFFVGSVAVHILYHRGQERYNRCAGADYILLPVWRYRFPNQKEDGSFWHMTHVLSHWAATKSCRKDNCYSQKLRIKGHAMMQVNDRELRRLEVQSSFLHRGRSGRL